MLKIQKGYFWWSFLLFAFLIPVSQFLSVRVLAILLVGSFFVPAEVSFSRFIRFSWEIFVFLLVLLIGLLYTEDQSAGFANIETSFSLLAVPLVLSRINLDEGKFSAVCYSFGGGMLAATMLCLVNAVIKFISDNNPTAFVYYEFTDVLHLQPTYFAYYLTFIVTVGIYFLYYEKSTIKPWILYAAVLFFFAMLLLTGGRTAYVSLLLVFSFFVLKYFLEDKSTKKNIVFVMIIVMIGTMFYFSSRDSEIIGVNNSDGDYWDRIVLWESALQAAAPHLIAGVGTGDYRHLLNEYYTSHGMSELADTNMNSHNQFIQILFSNGILGIIALVLMLSRPLYWSVRNDHILGTLCMFAFPLYGLTEVFLGRYQGVVFFALLHQLFTAHYRSILPVFSLK